MKKNLIVFILAIAAISIVYKIKSKQAVENSRILKIGISLPLTGSIAHLGESAQKGIELAYEELKRAKPSLNTEYFIEDNAFTGKAAVSAYRNLKDIKNIDAVITASSPATLATQALAAKDNILQIGIFASVPQYSSPDDLSFRIFPRSEREAEGIIEYLKKQPIKDLAVIYINNDYGQGMFSALSVQLAAGNNKLKVVSKESYLPGALDFKTLLSKIKIASPEALIMVSPAQDAVSIMRQARDIGLKTKFFAANSASDPAVLGTAAITEGLLVAEIFDPESGNRNSLDFIKNYKGKFGAMPDMFAAQGYDGYKLTALVLAECGSDKECIKSFLYNLKNYSTTMGNLNFDRNGDADYKYFIKVFKNGAFEKIRE